MLPGIKTQSLFKIIVFEVFNISGNNVIFPITVVSVHSIEGHHVFLHFSISRCIQDEPNSDSVCYLLLSQIISFCYS